MGGKALTWLRWRGENGERFGRSLPLCAIFVLSLSAMGCTRPTGDFDRARPSVVHDTVMPAVGEQAARTRGDPVSKFNLTNDEELLRDRAWALIRPPWTKDWIGGTAVELSRTRILPEAEGRVPIDLYYRFLASDRFRSSDARYDRVATDALGDAQLVWPFCEAALKVKKADEERLRVLSTKQILTEEVYEGAKARVWENRMMVSWAGQALRYRIKAYRNALDKLEIETPSGDRLWKVNNAIRRLEAEVRLAENGCAGGTSPQEEAAIKRSRIFTGWGLERGAPKK